LWVASNKNGKNDNAQISATKPLKPALPQSSAADSAVQNAAPVQPPVATAPSPATNLASNNSAQSSSTKLNPAGNTPANKLHVLTGNNTLNKPAGNAIANQQPATTLPAFTPSPINPATTNPVNGIAKTGISPAAQPANNSVVDLPGKKADSVKSILQQTNTQQFANNPAVQPPANTSQTNTAPITAVPSVIKVKQKTSSMESLLASDHDQPKKPDIETDERRVKFSVYAATFFNYAKGSQNQVNAGAGFTSDIKLSKNLRLSTGLALAQNTLNYNKNQPSNGAAAVSFSPSLTTAYNNTTADFTKVSSAPSFKNYNANLIGLDIPVNLKYEFNPQKNDTYISAGLSSGTFINEAYTASYSYPGLAQAAGVQPQTSDETTHKSFNSFYFAKTLNVAFGVGYPLGKSNKLIIEPFLKYPLDGLGSQQIKFGAGGLNLKLNFTTHKK
jgi:hypothetical protein